MDTNNNTASFLPVGNELREMISPSFLSASHLNELLNLKGIFIDVNDKNKSIPILTSLILSPNEFDFLAEKQVKKEDNQKINTLKINLNTDKDLLQIIPQNFSIKKLIEEDSRYKPNYSVIANPQFKRVDNNPKVVQLEYILERENNSKGWTERKTTHVGSITLELIGDAVQLIVRKNHTAKETDKVGELIIQNLKEHFKKESYIKKDTDFTRILFNDFTNKNRIQFFYGFTADFDKKVEFKEITDMDISPDTATDLPNEIKDIMSGINNILLKGKELQDHVFVQNHNYHEQIIFSSISLKYNFKFFDAEGTCTIDFSFPEYQKNKKATSEFQFNISNLSFSKNFKSVSSKTKTHKEINRIFEKYKLEQYEVHRSKF